MSNREITVKVLGNEMIEGTTKAFLTKTYSAEMDGIANSGWALSFTELPRGSYAVEIHLKDILLYDKVKSMITRLNNDIGVVDVTRFYPVVALV